MPTALSFNKSCRHLLSEIVSKSNTEIRSEFSGGAVQLFIQGAISVCVINLFLSVFRNYIAVFVTEFPEGRKTIFQTNRQRQVGNEALQADKGLKAPQEGIPADYTLVVIASHFNLLVSVESKRHRCAHIDIQQILGGEMIGETGHQLHIGFTRSRTDFPET